MPQMSVLPSRPIAVKTSGVRQPVASSGWMFARSSSITTCASLERRSTEIGAASTRE